MNIKIEATEKFKKYIEESYPDIAIQKSEIIVDGSYNAFFTMKPGDILISMLITYSPMMFNAIDNYVNTHKQNIVVTIDGEKYKITPQNKTTTIPIIQTEALSLLNEEKNGENRQF